jgi:hypothetical protein
LSHTDSLFDFVNQLILQTGYFLVCWRNRLGLIHNSNKV